MMFQQHGKGGGRVDIETGMPMYSTMLECPELRWSFTRSIFCFVAIQMVVTAGISAAVVTVNKEPITIVTGGGWALYIFLIVFPFIVLCPLYLFRHKHPVNLLLLGLFTAALSVVVGLTCLFVKQGKVILESAVLTAVVLISLILYTFWAARKAHNFNFLGQFLFSVIIILMVFTLIQIFIPFGRISQMIYAALTTVIFCGYIIYVTRNLIKRYSPNDYIWGCGMLYLDLFLSLLNIFRVVVAKVTPPSVMPLIPDQLALTEFAPIHHHMTTTDIPSDSLSLPMDADAPRQPDRTRDTSLPQATPLESSAARAGTDARSPPDLATGCAFPCYETYPPDTAAFLAMRHPADTATFSMIPLSIHLTWEEQMGCSAQVL